jgi:uncharacterized protein YndB with AHSA1/START domain
MPTFDDVTTSSAPVEEVWKLLYDPARFPEWWEGVETIEAPRTDGFTLYPRGYPDFPMPHTMRSEGNRVTISCLTSDLVFEWRLEPTDEDGTRIGVHVEIPEAEAHRLDAQRGMVSASLRSLAAVAAATDEPPGRG